MKDFIIALGSSVVALAFILNLSYSADNYGIKEHTLTFSVRAQDTGGGGDSNGGGGDSN